MTLEKLESLVSVMTNTQYERFQAAVIELLADGGVFSNDEIKTMEKRIHQKLKKENVAPKEEYGFTNILNVPTN